MAVGEVRGELINRMDVIFGPEKNRNMFVFFHKKFEDLARNISKSIAKKDMLVKTTIIRTKKHPRPQDNIHDKRRCGARAARDGCNVGSR